MHATTGSLPLAPPPAMVNPLHEAALAYAAQGIPVLPLHTPDGRRCSCQDGPNCPSPGKHPRHRKGLITAGLHAATTDPALIGRWWHTWPQANLAIRTGITVDVCDVDTRGGLRHLLRLTATSTSMPGPVVATGSGWHLWYQRTGHGNRVAICDAVDWRGHGGYALAPPSLHPCGRRYRWLRPPTLSIPVCPAELAALLVPPPPEPRVHRQPPRAAAAYVRAAVDAEVARVIAAPAPCTDADGYKVPGARNDALNRSAFKLGQLVAAGFVDAATVRQHLLYAAEQARLGHREAERTIGSGLRAGMRHPRPYHSPSATSR